MKLLTLAIINTALVLFAGTAFGQSTLTVYAYPSSIMLNWETPRSIMKDFGEAIAAAAVSKKGGSKISLVSDFGETGEISSHYKSSMGHAISHVKCQLPGGNWYDKWVSFSGQIDNSIAAKTILKDKLGIGYLLFPFPDGYLISGEENRLRLTYYTASDRRIRPTYFQMTINREGCQKLQTMVQFFESFHFPPGTTYSELAKKDPDQVLYFTGSIDPFDSYHDRLKTGHGRVAGGCAQFAMALVKEAGLLEPEFELWRRTMEISERLIGGALPNRENRSQQVPLTEILFGSLGASWTTPGTPSVILSGADPEMIWKFIGETSYCLSKNLPDGACPTEMQKFVRRMGSRLTKGPSQIFRDTNGNGKQVIEGLILDPGK